MKTASNILVPAMLFVALLSCALLYGVPAHAQTTAQDQLRATIAQEVMAEPGSKTMTQAQIYSLVNALTIKAQQQGVTASQLTYRPTFTTTQQSGTACSDVSCALGHAFGLDGSVPIIPIALFVLAALFILIYGIMREVGHPHAQA